MSDDDVGVYAYEGPTLGALPTGRKLDTPGAREVVFSVGGGLTPADDHRLRMARRNFTEATAEDFLTEGRYATDKVTGTRYRIVRFDPALSEDPTATGVTVFYVADGWLVYLRPVDATSRTRSVEMGTVGRLG